MAPILGYWDIRGFAQSIRLMLAYADEEYDEKIYSVGPAPDYDRSSWLNEKFTLGLDFPNLPYYIDGDVKITQSIAIMRYLARKLNLDADDDDDSKIKADVIEQQGIDFRMGFVKFAYNPDFDKLKSDYIKNLGESLGQFSKFLGKSDWFACEVITYVDFLLYEALDIHRELSSDCLKEFPNLEDFVKRFENQPSIKRYLKSDKFIKWPITSDMAPFGSRSTKK